jgi:hypothetical protein
MMRLFISVIAAGIFSGCLCAQTANATFWTEEKAVMHFSNQHDSLKWDMEMLSDDIAGLRQDSPNPMYFGAFPVPSYGLLGNGSFTGLGNRGDILALGNKNLVWNSFFVRKNLINEGFMGSPNRKDEAFFVIVVLTDTVDTVNFSTMSGQVISRNHPNYVGQGMYRTKASRVDYISFITADRNAYALVNMRLFDLRRGQVLLVAPQKDGSFRSLQVMLPALSSDNVAIHIEKMLKTREAEKFFRKAGNI